ncbi:TetR/AcrR family transcriptional regulator [Streptomyces sp. AV19]|uniref:TetR/AcrR family transcriptional regulator n=1 Tax=Streptomyces sp. AV19 TaxID=2793068 RepID=UPI0018FE173E|nr:TetR/AcrR family transcriptional regulator [Streptomyces sp. AV19]MBH1933216.1 TetR/AcrR family transcriptional regulator [Streptomyces sp. AV19]MDG4530684.1 TetR/AcrR family transcriptional regulator [Streptomyces sp. AV19]
MPRNATPTTPPAPLRSDARRNRQSILQAARSAFEEEGLGVPLGEIARRAGVGAGTVYRHFPSKDALFRATVVDRVRLFTDTARELADAEDPGKVFFRYLASVVRLSARNKGLCDALEAGAEGRFTPSPAVERDFREALDTLLTRAQQAGAVRKDVSIDDVMALLLGCLAMEQRGNAPGRLTALVCDGLRPGRNVTKLPPRPPRAQKRRDETRCAVCGGPLAPARTGRPARYCGALCRQKAYRSRTGSKASVSASEVVLEPEV